MDHQLICTICNELLHNDADRIVRVCEKGLKTLIEKSKEKNDQKWNLWSGKSSVNFHGSCRKRYAVSSTNPTSIRTSQPGPSGLSQPPPGPSALSSAQPQPGPSALSQPPPPVSDLIPDFDFKKLCIICGQSLDRAHKRVSTIIHNYVKDQMIDVAERRSDEEGTLVMQRLQALSCLASVRASYHKKCYDRFIIPPSTGPRTHRIDIEVQGIVDAVCSHIEESGKFQFRYSELQEIMGERSLSNKVLLNMLKIKYGDEIYIQQHRGRETIIYYKSFNVSKICSNWFCNEGSLGETEKKTILTVAAEILRDEILNSSYDNEKYSAPSKFLDNVIADVPPLLIGFLGDLLLGGKVEDIGERFIKRDVTAHTIVSLLRPKSFISNLQLAPGTYVYRKTGSKLIINILSKLGLCSSYHSIQLHEASTIMNPPTMNIDDAFVQYVFDNTDHNVRTLDGHATFHCLGGIAVYTPDFEVSYEGGTKKCAKMPSASVLASQKRIETIACGTLKPRALESIQFVSTDKLPLGTSPLLSPSYSAYLWSHFFKIPNLPSWKGFMEVIANDMTYSRSHIQCLPFINEPPSKLTTLNTALHHAATETRKINQKTCFVTFDQPLFFKARSIIAGTADADLKNVIVRLGGFHLLMSYLGAIGHIMGGSGLEDLWSVPYAPESIKKMLDGHAFSRAVRAHILSFTSLGTIICGNINGGEEFDNFTTNLFEKWDSEPPLMGDFNAEPMIKQMTKAFVNKLQHLEQNGPTAKLWVQYFKSVMVALQFIEAERLGNWSLHLQSIENMLPLFHASGHFAYAKSAQIYLQDMVNLEYVMDPVEFNKFTKEGYFTIHRSDKSWSGVWSDMTIEQTLNRFFGNDLKHGRGVTPSVVARYLLAIPSAFDIMECLEAYCGVLSATSEQHVDLSKSRIDKDHKDIQHFIFWLNEHSPFESRGSLMSLSTGIIGGITINCHLAVEKGLRGMALMIDKNAANVSLSTALKVKNLAAAQHAIDVSDENFVSVDTFLLFQRISVLFQGNAELTRNAFTYELSPFPLSLFDEQELMRKTPKSQLYKMFRPFIQSESILSSCAYVVDGGWLLHYVVWPHSKTYGDIFHLYMSYVVKHFGTHATIIVFDGYNSELIGIKSYERYRRKQKCVAHDVEIAEDKLVTLSQSKFLSNVANKYKFVILLSAFLKRHNIRTEIATEDADTLIVRTAIEANQISNGPVTIVGNDVDLLILLIGLAGDTDNILFYKVTSGPRNNVLYSTTYHRHLQPFILFAHAFAGCDTTSAIYNKGKKTAVSILEENENLQEVVKIFYRPGKTVDEIYSPAKQFIVHLFKIAEQCNVSLGEIRYRSFISSVASVKKEMFLALLPPTESTLREHSKRVYLQIQTWLGHDMNPEEWGWRRTHTMMLPIMTTKPPAPKELLEKVLCRRLCDSADGPGCGCADDSADGPGGGCDSPDGPGCDVLIDVGFVDDTAYRFLQDPWKLTEDSPDHRFHF